VTKDKQFLYLARHSSCKAYHPFGSSLPTGVCRKVHGFCCVITVCLGIVLSNTSWLYENMVGVLQEAVTSYPSWAHGFTTVFWWWCLLFTFVVFCVVFFTLFVFALFLVYSVLPVSLDCPVLIAPSVFSNVYIHKYIYSVTPNDKWLLQ